MSQKTTVFWGMMFGSIIGSCIPLLWGGSAFSFASLLLSAVGGVVGIWLGFRLGE